MAEAIQVLDTQSTRLDVLREKITSKTAKIAVIGAGYVGLPLAVEKGKAGYQVVCIDLNPDRVDQINRGRNYIKDVKDADLEQLVQTGGLSATTKFDVISDADVVVICVPTPLTGTKDPDISYIVSAAKEISTYMRAGQLISLESTTYPGTTEEVVLPLLERKALQVGKDFCLCFSPERVDPGNSTFSTKNTTKVVGGVTEVCLEMACTFYGQTIEKIHPVSSTRVAEMSKVFENTYRAVNIAFVNELAMLCDRMNISVWEVLKAASTKPFGIQVFWPGPGVGGHCIPLDPFYLSWKAREFDFSARFIDLAGDVNQRMPYFVKEKIARALSDAGRPLRDSKVLILGVAYKRDIEDERESPALKLIQILSHEGATVSYHDPYVAEIHPHAWFTQQMQSTSLTDDVLSGADVVVITTDHRIVDYDRVGRFAKLVVDTRNVMSAVQNPRAKVVYL